MKSPTPANLTPPDLPLASSEGTQSKPIISVSVRELVEFTCATGDLGGGSFSGPNRALEGTKGHQQVQRSRPAGYETEVVVRHTVEATDLSLRVAGRIDGVYRTVYSMRLEEIKTLARAWDRKADPLHWAQLKCYGWIFAQQHGLGEVELQLTYLELRTGRIHELVELWRIENLNAFFERTTDAYITWMRKELAWRACRDESLLSLHFPHRAIRAGQGEMIEAVATAISSDSKLFAEAPTGIGKTVSVLFPALQAIGRGESDKIFYLTAKGSGRLAAEKALADFRGTGARVRSLTLTARDKVCFGEPKPCDRSNCGFAKGYYDRSKAALNELLEAEAVTRMQLESIARKHNVCPFELSLDALPWVDVVICDYNYAFDPSAWLKRSFVDDDERRVFLVDEAHNLVDRAREMFSAEVSSNEMASLSRFVEAISPECAKALRVAAREVNALRVAPAELNPDAAVTDYGEWALPDPPRNLQVVLENVLLAAEAWLSLNKPAECRTALMDLYFKILAFVKISEAFDEHYATIIRVTPAATQVRLFCVDPSAALAQALERSAAAIFFSATMSPLNYYRQLLGGSQSDATLTLSSPFPTENLGLFINAQVRTDFRSRTRSYEEVARGIGEVAQVKTGRYMAFFPSHDYLQQTLQHFSRLFPTVNALVQTRAMSETAREEFLDHFDVEDDGEQALREGDRSTVGFAVMGGVFGEGIDLMGDRLIGAIVVGVGLPQVCLERNLIRAYFDQQNGAGFAFAYVYPGMNKVLQAAGRVIRSAEDRGVALLMDSRFKQQPYCDLLPPWWQPQFCGHAAVRELTAAFWR